VKQRESTKVPDDTSGLLVLGVVTQAYGIKGWVKVKSFTEPDTNLLNYKQCFLEQQGKLKPIDIEQGRPQGKLIALKLKGVDDRNQSELLRSAKILVQADALADLDDDEYYWHQLEGLKVYIQPEDDADSRILLGEVSHLIETGSNDVLVLKGCKGSLDSKERLIPYRPECVLNIDLASAEMLVDWDPEF